MDKFEKEICDSDPEKIRHRAAICKFAIQRLRIIEEADYSDAYVDYQSFKMNSKCSVVDVWIPSWNRAVHQPILFCPFRSSIIPMDTPHQFGQNYNYITAFPKTTERIMIFKLIEETNYYQIHKIISEVSWHNGKTPKQVPVDVFTISIPRSYSNIRNIYDLLHDFTEFMGIMRYVTYSAL